MMFSFNGKEMSIDKYLATQLNNLVYNIKNDWDFIIIITGDRTVRIGKSVLAMQICAYLSYALYKRGISSQYDIDHIFFDSKLMIKTALTLPQYSIVHYDEGRESLAASKFLSPLQQSLLDYFSQCGQLNHLFVVVLPDFFGLAEEIAVPRSEFLINIYRKDIKMEIDLFNDGEMWPVVKFKRGQYEFFSRYKKQDLYDKAKQWRKKNYNLVKANFVASFSETYPIDEELYRTKKRDYLMQFAKRQKEVKVDRCAIIRDNIIKKLFSEGKTGKEIAKILKDAYNYNIDSKYIYELITKMEVLERQVEVQSAESLII